MSIGLRSETEPSGSSRLAVGVWLRAQLNRFIAAVCLSGLLPVIVVAERLRAGSGALMVQKGVRRVTRICGLRFEVTGSNRLQPGTAYVLVPNHASPLDIPAILVGCGGVRFVAAAELFKIPLLGGAMRALGTIPLERRKPAVARRQLAEVAEGGTAVSLAIFPEGGIAPAGERLPFKSGAFSLAIQAGLPIVPVAIHGSDVVLPPRSHLAVRPGTVTVELLPPVETAGLNQDDRRALRDRVEREVRAALARGPLPDCA
ncbi:MAG TPA: lysophospholipid acyltransferase family protein [Acidimicrobiales bacterium]|nr:lysophospholipid acyltransferase family protein [Acidimicrobiales bacterium]